MSFFKRVIIISVYAHIIINNSNSQEIITQEDSDHIFYGSENFREIGGSFAQTDTGDLDGDGRDDLILSGKNQDGDGIILIFRGGRELPKMVETSEEIPDLVITAESRGSFGTGWAITDYNNDGQQDLIVIESEYESPSIVYAFNGSNSFFDNKERSANSANVMFEGSSQNEQCSLALSVNDINGDQIPDFIFGNSNARRPDIELGAHGRVMIYFGKENWERNVTVSDDTADVIIHGWNDFPAHFFGRTVTSADINNDEISDVITFAWWGNQQQNGLGFIFYGKKNWDKVIDLKTKEADVTITSPLRHALNGHSLDVADVNSDGITDLIFSGFNASTKQEGINNGIAHVIFGNESLPSTIDVTDSELAISIHGRLDERNIGYFVKAGDFNGDGINDVIYTGITDQPDLPEHKDIHGHAVLIYGSSQWDQSIDLDESEQYLYFKSEPNNRFFGTSANFLDWNHDGSMDVWIGDGAYTHKGIESAGAVYLYLGKTVTNIGYAPLLK